MRNLLKKDRFAESLNSVILFLSSMNTFLDFLLLWPASLKPRKSFSDLSRETSDLGSQLNLIDGIVSDVITKRLESSSGKNISNYSDGRFLIYSPLHATFDALASGETSGFFDEADAPPWSTWVAFKAFRDAEVQEYDGYLVAWIPKELIPTAQLGIDVSLGKSLFWADERDEVSSYGSNAIAFCDEVASSTMC